MPVDSFAAAAALAEPASEVGMVAAMPTASGRGSAALVRGSRRPTFSMTGMKHFSWPAAA